jgi:hypothetical protein
MPGDGTKATRWAMRHFQPSSVPGTQVRRILHMAGAGVKDIIYYIHDDRTQATMRIVRFLGRAGGRPQLGILESDER